MLLFIEKFQCVDGLTTKPNPQNIDWNPSISGLKNIQQNPGCVVIHNKKDVIFITRLLLSLKL